MLKKDYVLRQELINRIDSYFHYLQVVPSAYQDFSLERWTRSRLLGQIDRIVYCTAR
jgi:hypothetical protein